MLIIGIILLVVGAVMAAWGRRHEEIVYWGGLVLFAVGFVLTLIGALLLAGVDLSTNEAVFRL